MLLIISLTGPGKGCLISSKKLRTHFASLVAREAAMYSALTMEVATMVCFLNFHMIEPLFCRNMNSEMDLRFKVSPPQSESEYSMSSKEAE